MLINPRVAVQLAASQGLSSMELVLFSSHLHPLNSKDCCSGLCLAPSWQQGSIIGSLSATSSTSYVLVHSYIRIIRKGSGNMPDCIVLRLYFVKLKNKWLS
jgi:hypothetical protein